MTEHKCDFCMSECNYSNRIHVDDILEPVTIVESEMETPLDLCTECRLKISDFLSSLVTREIK